MSRATPRRADGPPTLGAFADRAPPKTREAPAPGVEDRKEHYNVTSYILTTENGQTKIELIQEDNRPFGFVPATLKPILVALKKVVEEN